MKLFPDELRFVFGQSRYMDRERFGPLHGSQIEMVHLRTGQVEVIADGVSHDIVAPAIFFVAVGRQLEYRYGGDDICDVFWCQCLGPSIGEALVQRLSVHNGVIAVSEAASTLFRLGAELPLRVSDGMLDFVASLAETLAQEIVGRRAAGDRAPKGESRVTVIGRYLEDNLEQALGMRELSEAFALTPQHINRLFRAAYGVNALDYLWNLRVRRGAFMLRHTGMPISQVAYRNGFKTPNHFSRLILRQYGLSPRKLRMRDWLGEG
ncbi:helix-turn-helix domain-containing protein [Pleomorphomonas sp. PLEO]|uniref:helix-turn-helix domain-containing protein n=1 Tax=Pleomorphomonas sp. PLEO TaxID=3239306 RepID=UPI00351F6BBA